MSENIASINAHIKTETSSTRGMTAQVIKGSFWIILGQIISLGLALLATPFIIRHLGKEQYGVLVLINLLPAYLAFADFGMGIASTKFGAEAFAQNSQTKEAEVIRTAALLGFATTTISAAVVFLFSDTIVIELLKIPEQFQYQAGLCFKFASVSVVLRALASIFNTPQLVRLRMDLVTLITVSSNLIQVISILAILFWGGTIVEVVFLMTCISLIVLIATIVVSGRLLPEIYARTIDKSSTRNLLKFGGGLLIASIAAILLVNTEKLVLTRLASVTALAYYSVAYTLAGTITLFSSAMVQSLVPAFSQLQDTKNQITLNNLYSRGIRVNLIWIVPAIVYLFIIAKPFFTIWVGEDFGRESTVLFYILLGGLMFNVIAYFPHSVITAAGRSDILAKIYWIELIPYLLLVGILTSQFGAKGAALAWSIRVITDAAVMFKLVKVISNVSYSSKNLFYFIIGALVMAIPIIVYLYFDKANFIVIITTLLCSVLYSGLIWNSFLQKEEKIWLIERLNGYVSRCFSAFR